MRKWNVFTMTVGLLMWGTVTQAQHVLILKNGRQITVQSYREEGSMIKFSGLGGEIGLPKDQVKAILKPGQAGKPGLNMSELETPASPTTMPASKVPSTGDGRARASDRVETRAPAENDEAKEYQKRLAELTEKLQTANRQYFEATQGGGTVTNASKEGMLSWAMDLASRIHDSQKVPGGGGSSSTPPTPPYAPNYTAKEKELSELRSRIDSLQKERDALVEEMKSKNIPLN